MRDGDVRAPDLVDGLADGTGVLAGADGDGLVVDPAVAAAVGREDDTAAVLVPVVATRGPVVAGLVVEITVPGLAPMARACWTFCCWRTGANLVPTVEPCTSYLAP